jgi:hypothetical protein
MHASTFSHWLRSDYMNFLPGLASNEDPSYFYFPSSYEYRCEPPYLASIHSWIMIIFYSRTIVEKLQKAREEKRKRKFWIHFWWNNSPDFFVYCYLINTSGSKYLHSWPWVFLVIHWIDGIIQLSWEPKTSWCFFLQSREQFLLCALPLTPKSHMLSGVHGKSINSLS